MTDRISYYGISDQGRKRKSNQDHFLIARLNKSMFVDQSSIAEDDHARFHSDLNGRLLLVADGMGGHAGGEVASHIAIDAAVTYVLNTIPWFCRLKQNCEEDFLDDLKRALDYCQQQLASEADVTPAYHNMGTTLTMGYVIGNRLYVVHVGDSRCYISRDGQLHQVTRDHTVAQELMEQGRLTPQEAETSPFSHVLWNSLGGTDPSSLQPDVYKCHLQEGDTVLLCTDGLNRHVTDEDIQRMLERQQPVKAICEELVTAANEGGGSDNITVVLALLEKSENQETTEFDATQVADPSSTDTLSYNPS